MPQFDWRRMMTRHFGEQWVPFADLRLRTTSGRWREFMMQFDTGAVTSVMPRSTANLLGLKLEEGEPVELAGVGARSLTYDAHPCVARIGDSPEFNMRIAFSLSEKAPNLLGRLDVTEGFRVQLDPLRLRTTFEPTFSR